MWPWPTGPPTTPALHGFAACPVRPVPKPAPSCAVSLMFLLNFKWFVVGHLALLVVGRDSMWKLIGFGPILLFAYLPLTWSSARS